MAGLGCLVRRPGAWPSPHGRPRGSRIAQGLTRIRARARQVLGSGAAVLGVWLLTWQSGESLFNRACWRAAHPAVSAACEAATAQYHNCRASCQSCYVNGLYKQDVRPALAQAGCTAATTAAFCRPVAAIAKDLAKDCPTHAALQAAATAWWPLLLGLFLLAVVRRRGARPAAGVAAERIETAERVEAAGVLTRAFHGLAAVQVGADFCSCFALGRLLGQATVPKATAGAAAFRTGALCWGYGITAFGFVLVRAPPRHLLWQSGRCHGHDDERHDAMLHTTV